MNNIHNKKFIPSAYRNWSVIYCQFGWEDWVDEFIKQFGWGLTDICFRWDGNVTTIYRIQEEHLIGLHDYFLEKVKKDHDYLKKIVSELYKEVKESELFFQKLNHTNLLELNYEDLLKEFNLLKKHTVRPAPKVLISIYLPQAIQFLNTDKNSFPYIDDLIIAREKLDHVIGPMGNKFAEKIAEALLLKINIDKSLAKFLSIDEFIYISSLKGILNDAYKKELLDNLNKRSHYFLVAGGKIVMNPVKNYLEDAGYALEEFNINTNNLAGKVSYYNKKIIRGTVKIILNKRQLNKIHDDDIIVAPMTTPEYAPIFSKVKAIITDEGGITCHAAIVAREMNIPTIVGVGFASKLLRDGNMVEMNMKNGSIKIIKK